MKVGIIGFGSIGKRHYDNLQRFNLDIVVLSKRTDIEAKHAKTWEEFASFGKYDVIFITNETSKHTDTINHCLKLAPRALFIEKPLSHTTENLQMIAKQLEENKISSFIGYNFHFFQPLVRVKEILKSGCLGKIYYFRVSVGQDLSEWRTGNYEKCYSSKKEGGGGVMLDLVHDLNYPAWLLGEKLFPEMCVMRKISDLKIDTEDYVEAILKSESGIMVSVHQDYVRVPYNRSLEISGSGGTLKWDSDFSTILIMRKNNEVVLSERIDVERNDMYQKEIDFFIKAVERGEYFSNFSEAMHDIKIIDGLKKYATR